MSTFLKLRDGEIKWSNAIGEYVKESIDRSWTLDRPIIGL